MIRFRFGILIGILGIFLPASAPASAIFSNFGLGPTYDTSTGNPVGNAFDGNTYAEGGTFVPTTNVNFGSVLVALSCIFGCPAADNFTVALSADAGNQPGAAIESFNFTGKVLGSLGTNNVPVQATSITKPLLTAGTRYWITVAATNAYSIDWNLNSTSDPASEAISTDGGSTWFAPSGNTPGAFEVDSAAGIASPEPSSGILLGGTTLLALRRRKIFFKKLSRLNRVDNVC